ncbi:MAG: LruC domain-containing protein [Balneolales bacterium]|nr:LruC domain-containing protein [Balneolales bacterium]
MTLSATFFRPASMWFVLVIALLYLQACNSVNTDNQDDEPNGSEFVDGFNFSVTNEVKLTVKAGVMADISSVAQLYNGHPNNGGKMMQQFAIKPEQTKVMDITVPNHVRESLYVISSLPNGINSIHKVNVGGNTAQVEISTQSAEPNNSGENAGLMNAPKAYNTIPVFEDFEGGSRDPLAAACWVFQASTVTSAGNPISGSFSVRTGTMTNPLSPPSVTTPWINFYGAGELTFSHKSDNNSANGSLRVIAVNEFGTPDFSNPLFTYNYSNGTGVRNESVAIPQSMNGVYRVAFFYFGNGGNQRGFLDNVSIPGAYASDPANNCEPVVAAPTPVEFNNFYPAEGQFGTLAFEDNWPGFGDYDMNDLVLGYNINEVTNANNQLIRLEYTAKIRATGGVLNSGFGLLVNAPNSAIESVAGNVINRNFKPFNGNGTEQGTGHDGTGSIIILWDDLHSLMPSFSNVRPQDPYRQPVELQVVVTFNTPQPRNILGAVPYNPFIFVHGTRNGQPWGGRGHEIHLPFQQPTSNVNFDLFKTSSDHSIRTFREDGPKPGMFMYFEIEGFWYTSREHLNWVLDIPVEWVYPRSTISVFDAYKNYKDWAISGGNAYPDWYLDTPGNLHENRVFRAPN